MEWYHVCWPRLTAKRVEPVVSISWASCSVIPKIHYNSNYIQRISARSLWQTHNVWVSDSAVVKNSGSFSRGRSQSPNTQCFLFRLHWFPEVTWYWYLVHVVMFSRSYCVLLRDAIRKRGTCCRPMSVRPSVCLSVTFATKRLSYCQFFFGMVALSFQLFSSPSAPLPNSGGIDSAAALSTRRWGNFFAVFDWNRRLSRKRYKIGSWLLWNVNRKS